MSIARTLLALVVSLTATVVLSAEPAELITNGGFEDGLAGWNPDAKYELVDKANLARTGKACLTGEVTGKETASPPGHQPGVLPRWLHEKGANVIIASGMGQRAQQLFAQNDIEVVVGASDDTPEQLVSAYINGTLEAGENICDH